MTHKKPSRANLSVDMQALADLAGVSRSTVSRALNDSPRVTQKTKDKIRALARQHNYVVNTVARGLRTRRTNIVCVIMMIESEARHQHSYAFFLEMMGSIADALSEADYDMLLVHRPFIDAGSFIESRVCQQADGLIVIGQGHHHEQLNQLYDLGVPLVVWGAQVPDRRYPVIGADNSAGACLAVDHLIAQGRRNIAFFGDTELPEVALRYRGYQESLAAAGLIENESAVIKVPFDFDAAVTVIEEYLDTQPLFDSLFCCSDVIAMAAISCLHNRGREVPDDVAVVGFDDIALAKSASPALTTVRQDVRRGGEQLVRSLLECIDGAKIEDVILHTELVVRRSS